MVVASSNNFLLTLQDIVNPDLSFIFGKIQVIKRYSRFSRFLLLRQDYTTTINNNNKYFFKCWVIILQVHEILVFITCAQTPHLNALAGVSNWARSLYLYPLLVCRSTEGTSESAHISRLVWAFVARQ